MAIPMFAESQVYSSLIGVTYKNQTELSLLKNCEKIETKVDFDRYLCSVYFDTINTKYIVLAEKENEGVQENTYTILDVIEFGSLNRKQHLLVGSAEGIHLETHRFVIAIDCCYKIDKAEDWPDTSFKMYKAWAINKRSDKIERLKAKRVTRVGEGFTWP
jgi:hypothetical protein